MEAWQPLLAQQQSVGCRFELAHNVGCAPFSVSITELKFIGTLKDYDFDGDGTFEVGATSFTYNNPGTYTLYELTASQPVRLDSIQITVLEARIPDFSVGLCGSNGAQVNITDTYYDEYFIDYDDGTTLTINRGDAIPPHTYATQGTYNVMIRGIFTGASDNCGVNAQSITTQPILPPATFNFAEVNTIDNSVGQVTLAYNLNPGITYELEQSINGTAAFSTVTNLTDPNAISVEDLNTATNFYCYRIATVDECTNTRIYSDPICTINLSGTAVNNINQLSWSSVNPGSTGLTLQRDGAQIATLPGSQSTYDDTDVNCGTTYCYRLIDGYANGSFSTSAEICIEAISNDIPDPVTEITSSIVDGEVTLVWDIPTGFTPELFTIFRSINQGQATQFEQVTSNTFVDDEVNIPANTYCYYLTYTDVCGNTSMESITTCPIILTSPMATQREVSLSWTPYDGWINGVNEYIVEVLDDQGAIITTFSAGGGLSFRDIPADHESQVIFYRIRAISNHSTPMESLSNLFRFQLEPLLFIPNAFSPNDDGLNDTFEAKGKFFEEYRLLIFNRWGELLYETTNPDQGWDGTFNGETLPATTYTYRVDVTDFLGISTIKHGTFLLIR